MYLHQLSTPAAIVNLDIVEKNIQLMAQIAKQAGKKLRPHIKTHKIPAIAKMQLEAGAAGITCAKISEAEVMAQYGAKDILLAFPTVGEAQVERILNLSRDCSVSVAFDSVYGAERLHEAAKKRGVVIPLYMIINTGDNRDGVASEREALELAQSISLFDHVRLKGIMTHEGHVNLAKDTEQIVRTATAAGRMMVGIADMLRQHGFNIEEVSTGTTPACRAGVAVEGVTEWRPGTYVFNDVREMQLATPMAECAFSILATVVSRPAAERLILDTGSKSLTSDISTSPGYGYIKQAPSAVIERLSEEHGMVKVHHTEDLQIGQRVEIIPNHVCPVVNLMDRVFVVRNDEVIDEWKVEARGKII
ncbi:MULTISPECIES: alanine racemase [Paenibacillus]|uniref:Alanine racemase n=2 Tax=Paenibacillus TaxID=44249 RepID=A0A7X2ZAH3_9BACL|nr:MULTISPECIES: alanine racemase [Paenibacillus]MUG70643.1 alanine racemase [Paenibacillus validus]